MTLENWLIIGGAIIAILVAGGTVGVGVFAIGLRTRYESDRRRALAEQAETHRIEMQELVSYNSRLEQRVTELEAQLSVVLQALKDARIAVPKTGPLFSVAGDANFGGDAVGGDKRS